MFAMGGVLMCWFVALAVRSLASRRWHKAEAVVVESRLLIGTTVKIYTATVKCSYFAQGTEYIRKEAKRRFGLIPRGLCRPCSNRGYILPHGEYSQGRPDSFFWEL